MDKLIKFGKWVWFAKERAVLGVVLLVLCFSVYRVVFPPPPEAPADVPPAPSTSVAEIEDVPPPPPDYPAPYPQMEFRDMVRANPWSWDDSRRGGPAQPEGPDVELDRIMMNRVRLIIDGQRSRLLKEGDTFEGYTVVSVDETAQSCVLESAETGETLQLSEE